MATTKGAELLEFVREEAQGCTTWVQLHNAVFGIGGKLGELFPSQSERIAFSNSDEFATVAALIESLPTTPNVPMPREASGQFRLRLPKSLHAALAAEADAEGVSLNQLCLAKLAVQLRAIV